MWKQTDVPLLRKQRCTAALCFQETGAQISPFLATIWRYTDSLCYNLHADILHRVSDLQQHPHTRDLGYLCAWVMYVCIRRAIDSPPIWRAYKCPLKRIVPRGVPFKCNSSLAAVNHILLQHQLLPLSKDTYRAKEKQTVLWKYTVWRMKDKHPLGPKGSSCEWNWCAQQAASSDAGEVSTHMLTSRLPDILVFNNLAYSFS